MSFNPVKNVFYNQELHSSAESMTLSGTLAKMSYLFIALAMGAAIGVFLTTTQSPWTGFALGAGFIGALICGIITVFAPHVARFTAVPYAFGQGITLSIISQVMELRFPGIAITAVTLTGATALAMFLLYRFEIIKVTETLRSVIFAATAAIGITYAIVLLLWLVGVNTTPFYQDAGLFSIGFSLFVVGIAAFNLLLDFDLIEKGAENGFPKFMEWYAAFSFLVTLIWLYLEILRLLAKLSRRR